MVVSKFKGMERIILIGNGMVGHKFCSCFAEQANKDKYSLRVFGEEVRPAYDRVHLSEFFSKGAEPLALASSDWYKQEGISLHCDEKVIEIDRINKRIRTSKERTFDYDHLVLAMGSYPFVPPIEGVDKEGVFLYRTIDDLVAMRAYAEALGAKKQKPKAVVLGGGLLGLEAAKAVTDLGLEASVVEFAPKLMPRQLDQRSSNILLGQIQEMGIEVLLDRRTKSVCGEKSVEALSFEDGEILDADMLVVSAGIRARDALAQDCGLLLGARGGVEVDASMRTDDPNIYAIGEVASFAGMTYGLVAPGYEMAKIAADHLFGPGEKEMKADIDMSTKLKLLGVEVASFGEPFMPPEKGLSVIYENKTKGLYKRINVSHDKTQLLGGILVGDASDYNMLHQIYLNKLDLPTEVEELILGGRTGAEVTGGTGLELPDEAQVCSCESVSKGSICQGLLSGKLTDLGEVISSTKATTGCGGCKPLVSDLVQSTLKSMGIDTKSHICEHFDYSRQELYDLIRLKKLTSFDEVIESLGRGKGCEKCQPLVASLFASLYGDTANKEDNIQDTNDRFLANIQRNGSYSVVPRIPGGEITPQKLIALGQVADKYKLYTKITGGQRIDLFGAELNDLPSIWRELIEAGFESGHAYGKSLRTVKSCVGSTWCRYGMDESVSFAIELENRYKGLRSPHKIKGGVSGCIRECAEARGKDFGLIAVEGGWNLYVCGNGGANPKHALLLAEQIDNETCVKYLDRFLMYYIRTAAPLTRTSVWLDKIEGGLEHLKAVVVEDSLGIAEDLEKEMESLVAAYQCEWKEAIEQEGYAKRFRHFVNSEEKNDQMVFVPMRDQSMPKAWTE